MEWLCVPCSRWAHSQNLWDKQTLVFCHICSRKTVVSVVELSALQCICRLAGWLGQCFIVHRFHLPLAVVTCKSVLNRAPTSHFPHSSLVIKFVNSRNIPHLMAGQK